MDYNKIKNLIEKNKESLINSALNNFEFSQSKIENVRLNYNSQMYRIQEKFYKDLQNHEYSTLQMLYESSQKQFEQVSYFRVNNLFFEIFPDFVPISESGKIVSEIVKAIFIKIIKDHLSEEEKVDFETCKNIIDTFNASSTLNDPTKTKMDKSKAIIELLIIWKKYFPNSL